MTATTIAITGMSCDHCVQAVRGSVEQVVGVRGVSVSVGRAEVQYDHAACTIADLVTAVRRAGPFEVAGFSTQAD